jgi:D-alanine-D-alanine ligase
MRICVLADEVFGDYTPERFLKNYKWKMYNVKRPAFEFIRDIAMSESYDVYMNLCDGTEDEDRPGMDAVQALEALALPFTGADSGFYEPTRDQMRAIAEKQGVGFPRGLQVKNGADLEKAVKGMRYPMIVKHHDSYASVGMSRKSRVENAEELRVQFDAMSEQFGSARIEEFVDGREFTVLIADNPDDLDFPYVYHPLEILFPSDESFKHWDMKFDPNADMDLAQVSDPKLKRRLETMVRKMYLGMGAVSYGRADIRMNQDGELFILELNSNPSVLNMPEELASADYMMEWDKEGVEGFLDRIFRSAIVRLQKREVTPQLTRRRKLEPVVVRK